MTDVMHVNPAGELIPAPIKCPNHHPVKRAPCEFSLGHAPASPKGKCVAILPLIFRAKKIYHNYYWNP